MAAQTAAQDSLLALDGDPSSTPSHTSWAETVRELSSNFISGKYPEFAKNRKACEPAIKMVLAFLTGGCAQAVTDQDTYRQGSLALAQQLLTATKEWDAFKKAVRRNIQYKKEKEELDAKIHQNKSATKTLIDEAGEIGQQITNPDPKLEPETQRFLDRLSTIKRERQQLEAERIDLEARLLDAFIPDITPLQMGTALLDEKQKPTGEASKCTTKFGSWLTGSANLSRETIAPLADLLPIFDPDTHSNKVQRQNELDLNNSYRSPIIKAMYFLSYAKLLNFPFGLEDDIQDQASAAKQNPKSIALECIQHIIEHFNIRGTQSPLYETRLLWALAKGDSIVSTTCSGLSREDLASARQGFSQVFSESILPALKTDDFNSAKITGLFMDYARKFIAASMQKQNQTPPATPSLDLDQSLAQQEFHRFTLTGEFSLDRAVFLARKWVWGDTRGEFVPLRLADPLTLGLERANTLRAFLGIKDTREHRSFLGASPDICFRVSRQPKAGAVMEENLPLFRLPNTPRLHAA